MDCKIMHCTCSSDFQDKEYGKGMRVYNLAPKKKEYHCTVCGNKVLA